MIHLPKKKFLQPLMMIVGAIGIFALLTKFLPSVAGTILCLILIGGYYGLIWRALRFSRINFREIFMNDLPRIFLVAAVGTIFIVAMIHAQETIYIGDQLETYEPTISCEETVFNEPYRALKELRHSINHADYNDFLPMLMALPMHLFGKSFLRYELYVWLMFGLPAIFFAAATFKSIFDGVRVRIFSCSALMAIIMLFPIVEIPIFVGYANISIMLPAAIILAVLLSLSPSELQREPLILIAVLSVVAVLQARTAAYMIFGIFVGYAVYVVIEGIRGRALLADAINLCQKFFVIGVAGMAIMTILFFPLVKHLLTFDAGTAYSAYTLGLSFPDRIFVHANYLGYLIYGLFLIGVLVSLFSEKFMAYAGLCAGWFFTAEFLICRVQLIDRQHNYTMILPFALVFMMLFAFAWERRKKFGAALILILAFNCLQPYFLPLNLFGLFHGKYEIPVRKDIDSLKKFVADMNDLTAGTDKKIFILMDSELYNNHTLTKIFIPDSHNALPSLLATGDIDLRDGFSTRFFDANYIVVPKPLQIHMRPQDQQIIVKPYELMTTDSPISRHFNLVREYRFSVDATTSVAFEIYEKISPIERSDVDFVEKIFDELYPGRDELFKNRFERYKHEHFKE